jgi:hypothetical protein
VGEQTDLLEADGSLRIGFGIAEMCIRVDWQRRDSHVEGEAVRRDAFLRGRSWDSIVGSEEGE